MSKQCNLEALRMELFDTLTRVKSLNDDNCDANEKCSIEEAEAIVHIASAITDTYKVQVQALNILARADNPNAVQKILLSSGLNSE